MGPPFLFQNKSAQKSPASPNPPPPLHSLYLPAPFLLPLQKTEKLNGSDNDMNDTLLATSVACGAWHTLVLTSTGRLFAFGDGFTGQLGLLDRGNLETAQAMLPREVHIERRKSPNGSGAAAAVDVRIAQVTYIFMPL